MTSGRHQPALFHVDLAPTPANPGKVKGSSPMFLANRLISVRLRVNSTPWVFCPTPNGAARPAAITQNKMANKVV